MIKTVFDIDIVRIERTADKDEVSFKWCDYSVQTIDNLIIQGVKDTLNSVIQESLQRNKQDKSKVRNEINSFTISIEDEEQRGELDGRYARLLIDNAKL